MKETTKREKSEEKRFAEYYDIKLDDQSFYDLIINNERIKFDAVHSLLETLVEQCFESVGEKNERN